MQPFFYALLALEGLLPLRPIIVISLDVGFEAYFV